MKHYASPEELQRRKLAAANQRARKEQPFKPEPYSQGPHAHTAHNAGGKLIGARLIPKYKLDAQMKAYAPGCASPFYPYGEEAGPVICGSKVDGEQVFCGYCRPSTTSETNAQKIVDILLEDEDFDMEGYALAALTPKEAYDMSYSNPELRPKLEPTIAKSAEWSYLYALSVLKRKPFPLGEPAISTSARYSYCYARYCLKGKPFPAGEPVMATSAEYSYYYAIDVLQRRFPAGEPALATDACMAYDYNQRFGTSI